MLITKLSKGDTKMGSLNKAQLIKEMSKEMETTRADAERFLDCFIDTVQKQVKEGQNVKLVGFGTFTKSKRKEKMGRNPQTGQEIKIPAAWVPKFRPGSEFKSLCN